MDQPWEIDGNGKVKMKDGQDPKMPAPQITVNIAEALVLKSGDKVLITLDAALSAEDAEGFLIAIEGQLPDIDFTVLSGGAKIIRIDTTKRERRE